MTSSEDLFYPYRVIATRRFVCEGSACCLETPLQVLQLIFLFGASHGTCQFVLFVAIAHLISVPLHHVCNSSVQLLHARANTHWDQQPCCVFAEV